MTILYQAYGRQDVVLQTMFSVTSLFHHLKADTPQVIIYTDGNALDEFFKSTSVQIVKRLPAQFKLWRGEIDFVHRVKLEVLVDAGRTFIGSMLYLDGDTYFLNDPRLLDLQISDETSIMHIAEAQLGKGKDPLTKKICKFAMNHRFWIGNDSVPLSKDTVMWNAGVIGLSEKNKALLPAMIELTDNMFKVYPKHVIEQLAVSMMLQWKTKIFDAQKYVYHYWNQKPQYQAAIETFLKKHSNLQSAVKSYSAFVFPPPPRPKQSLFQKICNLFHS